MSNESLEEERKSAGMLIANWSADINNTCDEGYDGTLYIRFFRDEEDRLYERTDYVILRPRQTVKARSRVNLTVESLEEIHHTEIEIVERKRPQ